MVRGGGRGHHGKHRVSASFPTLFVSHGAPTLALDPGQAGDMLRTLAPGLNGASALIVASAHWITEQPTLGLSERPPTIHDFRGFPAELYQMRYPAPGAPAAARRALELLAAAGIQAGSDPERGLDHGAWVPLRYLAPAAGTPVTQLSLSARGSTHEHFRIGAALQPLAREGIVLLGSGSLTHNLAELDRSGTPQTARWAQEFADWFAARVEDGDVEALLDYRRRAPQAARNHPTEEHLLPFFVALGANGGRPMQRRPGGVTFGALAMDAFVPLETGA